MHNHCKFTEKQFPRKNWEISWITHCHVVALKIEFIFTYNKAAIDNLRNFYF